MPKRIPFPTPGRAMPEGNNTYPETPEESEFIEETPEESMPVEGTPNESPQVETTPDATAPVETTPEPSPGKQEMPSDVKEENCVTICGIKVELKPTKLKYFRNKTAGAYSYLQRVPLSEMMKIPDQAFIQEGYTGADQMLYDFLVAAFDDSSFVRDHYDDMTADDVEQVVRIFGRLNHIDEKDTERKNREAQAAKR